MNQALELIGGLIVFFFMFFGLSALVVAAIFFLYGEK